MTEEEQRIWSAVSWPSTLPDVLRRSIKMAKAKTKLTVDTIRATSSMLPPIPAPRITPIDEGSPLRKPDDIPGEPLPSSPPKFTIDENMQHIILVINKDKGKKPISDSYQAHYSGPPPNPKSG